MNDKSIFKPDNPSPTSNPATSPATNRATSQATNQTANQPGCRCDSRLLRVAIVALIVGGILAAMQQFANLKQPDRTSTNAKTPIESSSTRSLLGASTVRATPPLAVSSPSTEQIDHQTGSAISSGTSGNTPAAESATILSELLAGLQSAPESARLSIREKISALTATPQTKNKFAELVRTSGVDRSVSQNEDGIMAVLPLMRLGNEGVDALIASLDSRPDDEEYFDAVTTEAGMELSDENRTYLTKMVLEQSSDIAQEILRKADLIESEQIYGEQDD